MIRAALCGVLVASACNPFVPECTGPSAIRNDDFAWDGLEGAHELVVRAVDVSDDTVDLTLVTNDASAREGSLHFVARGAAPLLPAVDDVLDFESATSLCEGEGCGDDYVQLARDGDVLVEGGLVARADGGPLKGSGDGPFDVEPVAGGSACRDGDTTRSEAKVLVHADDGDAHFVAGEHGAVSLAGAGFIAVAIQAVVVDFHLSDCADCTPGDHHHELAVAYAFRASE